MAAESGSAARKRQRDRQRAAELKRLGVVRTSGRCAICYRIIVVDSNKSRYSHNCKW